MTPRSPAQVSTVRVTAPTLCPEPCGPLAHSCLFSLLSAKSQGPRDGGSTSHGTEGRLAPPPPPAPLEGQGPEPCKRQRIPKSSGVGPKFQSPAHSLPTCLMAQRAALLDPHKGKAPLPLALGRGGTRAWVTSRAPGGLWQGPSAVSATPRLPRPVPELGERGDPERSPGRAEGHHDRLGDRRPPHTHRGPLQSHRAGHHPDRRPAEVRDFPCPGAAGLGGVRGRARLGICDGGGIRAPGPSRVSDMLE